MSGSGDPTLNTLTGWRPLVLEGHYSVEQSVHAGIVAGGTHAAPLLRTHTMSVLDSVVAAQSGITLKMVAASRQQFFLHLLVSLGGQCYMGQEVRLAGWTPRPCYESSRNHQAIFSNT